jgi:GPI transamidase subunit PIG-U
MPSKRKSATGAPSFLSTPSTYVVTLIRVLLMLLPHLLLSEERGGGCGYDDEYVIDDTSSSRSGDTNRNGRRASVSMTARQLLLEWLDSPALRSVLVRPHETLAHWQEAHAVRALSSGGSVGEMYGSGDHSIRIPPLVYAAWSPWMGASAAGASAPATTTTATTFFPPPPLPPPDLLLSCVLLLVDLVLACMLDRIGNRLLLVSVDDGTSSRQNDEEERLQRIMPEVIRPPYAHIFPIHGPSHHHQQHHDSQPPPAHQQQREREQEDTPVLIAMARLPLLAAQLYYWSPLTALPSAIHHCWQCVPALFLVASIHEACGARKNRRHGDHGAEGGGNGGSSSSLLTASTFCLAVAAYLEPHHAVFLIPNIVLHCRQQRNNDHEDDGRGTPFFKVTVTMASVALFLLWSFCLHGLSYTLVMAGGPTLNAANNNYYSNNNYVYYWNAVLGAMYGNAWMTTSPNLSLQWYFHIQLFSRFRAYFGAMFTGIPFVLVGPLVLRFGRDYPEVLVRGFALFLKLAEVFMHTFLLCRDWF